MTVGSASDSAALEAARKGLAAARDPRAPGPRAEPAALRTAYLELLKLCLCDLTGASTASVGRTGEGVVASRELTGEQLRLRAAGMDWPLQGLTMVGLDRLDDLQRCVESIVRDGVEGDLIEAGAWRGGASILMRATLDSIGGDERAVWVADSFQGFPRLDRDERLDDQWGEIDYLAVSLEEVKASFARLGCDRGVCFLPGFFADSLPALAGRQWSLVRLDGDTYEATSVALESLYPGLAIGGYLIVDDYGALEECRRAVDEFRARYSIDEPVERVDWTCVRWRRERAAPEGHVPESELGAPEPGRRSVQGTGERGRKRVPTLQELALTGELAAADRRLAEAEAELARLRSSPVAAARELLRRTLDRRRAS